MPKTHLSETSRSDTANIQIDLAVSMRTKSKYVNIYLKKTIDTTRLRWYWTYVNILIAEMNNGLSDLSIEISSANILRYTTSLLHSISRIFFFVFQELHKSCTHDDLRKEKQKNSWREELTNSARVQESGNEQEALLLSFYVLSELLLRSIHCAFPLCKYTVVQGLFEPNFYSEEIGANVLCRVIWTNTNDWLSSLRQTIIPGLIRSTSDLYLPCFVRENKMPPRSLPHFSPDFFLRHRC